MRLFWHGFSIDLLIDFLLILILLWCLSSKAGCGFNGGGSTLSASRY
jgi:hypothetical protein